MSRIAVDIPAEKMAAYRQTARLKARLEQERLEARRIRGWEVARRAASLLKEEFGATKVVLFGSMLAEKGAHLRSDIDLAVWGLPERDYFRAVSRLLSLDADFEVDLVAFDDARPAVQAVILAEGAPI